MPEATLRLKLDGSGFSSGASQGTRSVRELREENARLATSSGVAGRAVSDLRSQIMGFLTIGAAAAAIRGFIKDASEVQRVQALLGSSVRATGAAAGYQVAQLNDLAGSLSALTGKDDDAIAAGLAVELTYTNIGRNVFPLVAKAALDLAARGNDLQGSFQMIGKAAQDPGEALGLLERSLGKFDDATEATIKRLSDLGRTEEAQMVLLRELNKRIGGTAEDMRRTLGGSLEATQTMIGNVSEAVGAGLSPVLIELSEGMGKALNSEEFLQDARAVGAAIGELLRMLASLVMFVERNLGLLNVALLGSAALMGGPVAAAVAGLTVLYLRWAGSVNASYQAELQRLSTSAESKNVLDMLTDKTRTLTDAEWLRVDAIRATMAAQLARDQAALNSITKGYASRVDKSPMALEAFDEMGRPLLKKLGIDEINTMDRWNRELEDAKGNLGQTRNELKMLDELIAKRGQERPQKPPAGLTDMQKALESEAAKIRESIRFNNELAQAYKEGGAAVADVTKAHELRLVQMQAETKFGAGLTGVLVALTSAEIESGDRLAINKQRYDDYIESIRVAGDYQAQLNREIEQQARENRVSLTAALRTQEIDAVQRAVDLVQGLRTAEEQRLDNIAEAVRLYNTMVTQLTQIKLVTGEIITIQAGQRALSAEGLQGVMRQNANPLFTPEQADARRFVDDILVSFRGIRGQAAADMAAVEEAFREAGHETDMAAEKELALGRIRQQSMEDQLAAWGQFFAYLSQFGGILAKISSGMQTVNSAVQAFKSLGDSLEGQAGSTVASAGLFVGIVTAIWGAQRQSIERDRQHRYTSEATFDWSTGQITSMGRQGRAIADQLSQQLHAIFDIIGKDIDILPSIIVRAREDGQAFEAWAGTAFVGVFATMQQAIDAAILTAVRSIDYSGISEAMRYVLTQVGASSVEELQSNLEFVRRLETQNQPQVFSDMAEAARQFAADWQRATELFQGNSVLLIGALTSISTQFATTLWNTYNQITGRKEDPRVEAERQRIAYNAQRTIIIAQITLMIAEIDARIADLRAMDLHEQGIERHARGVLDVTEVMVKAGGILFEGNGAILHDLEEQRQQLEDLRNSLPPPIAPGDVHVSRGGGGGRQDRAQAARDWHDRYDAIGASEPVAGLLALNQQIRDMRETAVEARIPIEEQRAAEARLTEEYRRGLQVRAETLAGVRTQWDDRLQEVTDFFNGLEQAASTPPPPTSTTPEPGHRPRHPRREEPAGASGAGAQPADGKVMAGTPQSAAMDEERRQELQRLAYLRVGQEAIASLGLAAYQFLQGVRQVSETMDFLTHNAEKFGLTEQQIADLRSQMQDQTFLGLADQMSRYITDEAEKRKLAEMRYDIERGQMLVMIEMAHTFKAVTDAQYAELLRLHGLMPENLPTGEATTTQTSTVNSFDEAARRQEEAARLQQQAAEKFAQSTQSLLEAFTGIYTDPSLGGTGQERLDVAKQAYETIAAQALAGNVDARNQYGAAARAYLEALNEFNAGGDLYGRERERIRMEFEALFAATHFTVDNVTYGAGFGQAATQPIVYPPASYTGGGGTVTADMKPVADLLQAILVAMTKEQAEALPLFRSISNGVTSEASSMKSLIDALERLISKLKAAA